MRSEMFRCMMNDVCTPQALRSASAPITRPPFMRFLFLLFISLTACEGEQSRDAIGAQSQSLTLPSGIQLNVSGASILSALDDEGESRIVLRAQSLDPRVDVSTLRCAAHRLRFEISQLAAPSGLDASWRPFLSTRSSASEHSRQLLGAGVELEEDLDDPEKQPLGDELQLPLSRVGAKRLSWWSLLDYGALSMRVSARPPSLPRRAGTCSLIGDEEEQSNTDRRLLLRHRFRYQNDQAYRFAIAGGIRGDMSALNRLIDTLNAEREDSDKEPLLFLLLNGDLTESGSEEELIALRRSLRRLTIPWFATAGDYDATGRAITWIRYLGTSSFAFELGILRVIVLDSGDRRLSASAWSQLGDWLSDAPLWWKSSPTPRLSLVVTHSPPIYGADETIAFQQELDGMRLISKLLQSGVFALIHSGANGHQSKREGGIRQIQSGVLRGEGRWLELKIAAECAPRDQIGQAIGDPCGVNEDELLECAGGSVCLERRCEPCWTLQSRQIEGVDAP